LESEDAVPLSTIDVVVEADSQEHIVEPVEEMEAIDAGEQGVEVDEFGPELGTEPSERDDRHDTVNVMVSEVEESNIVNDVSSWNIPVPDHLRVEIVRRGSVSVQNKDGPFSVVTRQNAKEKGQVRQLSKEWFYKLMPNGEKILRSWMLYSIVNDQLYCFCCRLFAVNATGNPSKFVTGFQKWWKLNPKVQNHESTLLALYTNIK